MKIITKYPDDIIQNNNMNRILAPLLLLSFMLIPFDDLPYLTQLSGVGRRAAMYPFFIIIPIITFMSLKKFKFYFKLSIEKICLLLFYLWTIVSIAVNIPNILNNFYKGESGISKAIIHLITLTFVILIAYCTEIILLRSKITLFNIRTAILLSIIPVSIVSSIEIINLLAFYNLSNILEKITYIFNLTLRGYVYGGRARGVSAEASYLGMYCAFVFPWIISYLYTEENKLKKVLFTLLSAFILLVVIATKSRTATILILFELVSLFGLILLFYKNIKFKIYTFIFVIICYCLLMIYPKALITIMDKNTKPQITTPSETPEKPSTEYEVGSLVSSVTDNSNLSNIARSSMQNAAIKMAIDNPIFGVGLGEFGFNVSPYVDDKYLVSHEVQVWLDDNNPAWPPVHSLYHRVVSEMGFVGLIFYFVFIFIICLKLLIKIIKSKNDLFGIFLLISYSSIIIGSLTIDTLLLTHFWLMTAVVTVYNNNKLNVS